MKKANMFYFPETAQKVANMRRPRTALQAYSQVHRGAEAQGERNSWTLRAVSTPMTNVTPIQPQTDFEGNFCVEQPPSPCGIVIFGASGNLTKERLIPALFHLFERSLLPSSFFILGCARSPFNDETFRTHLQTALQTTHPDHPATTFTPFLKHCYYQPGDYNDPPLYAELKTRLSTLHQTYAMPLCSLFYLATPPHLYPLIVDQLAAQHLTREEPPPGWVRVVVEKPFGTSLATARQLNQHLLSCFTEKQIYRIDHYLGKETVQNILMFRFANALFEPLWNRNYIDHIQITVAESIGVEDRAGYFDPIGTLRDMFQNHMLQLMALIAMEPPTSFEADQVREERVKLLHAIKPFPLDQLENWLVRGQYEGYQKEAEVPHHSQTETYVAAKIFVDNWRWQGVPFYLRSGKRLTRRVSEVAIIFKHVPHSMFHPLPREVLSRNTLIFHVQPEEGVSLAIQTKYPGPKLCLGSLAMDYRYEEIFQGTLPDAYERLLLDAMIGDQTLFIRQDSLEVAWALIDPILNVKEDLLPVIPYPIGSSGPPAANQLLTPLDHHWRPL